jgi:hypothetical protein
MKLTLVRKWFGPDRTVGKLLVNGVFRYWVLEDIVRPDGEKVYGATAIPYGKYPISSSYSSKFGKTLASVDEVPNFSGIRIHAGVDEKDTSGCLLVSRQLKNGVLVYDPGAASELNATILNSLNYGNNVTLRVTNYQRRNLFLFLLAISLMGLLILIFMYFL